MQSPGGIAPIDEQRRARHEARCFRGEENGGRPELARLAPASQWHVGFHLGRATGSLSKGVLISVANGPGQSAFTLIPSLAHSSASVLVRSVSPPLLDAYGVRPGNEISPSMLETLITRPHFCRFMVAATARQHSHGPFRLVSTTVSQSSSCNSSIGPRMLTPALLTRMSMRPDA